MFLDLKKRKEDCLYWASNNINVDFNMRDEHKEFLTSKFNKKLIRGERATGKTTVILIDALHKAVTKNGSKVVIIFPTEQQRMYFSAKLRDVIKNSPKVEKEVKINTSCCIYFLNGSSIDLVTTRTRGGYADYLYVDQADYLPQVDIENILYDCCHTDNVVFSASVYIERNVLRELHRENEFGYKEFFWPRKEKCNESFNYEREYLAVFEN